MLRKVRKAFAADFIHNENPTLIAAERRSEELRQLAIEGNFLASTAIRMDMTIPMFGITMPKSVSIIERLPRVLITPSNAKDWAQGYRSLFSTPSGMQKAFQVGEYGCKLRCGHFHLEDELIVWARRISATEPGGPAHPLGGNSCPVCSAEIVPEAEVGMFGAMQDEDEEGDEGEMDADY